MNVVEIIEKKKYGRKLSQDEIDYVVQGFSKGDIPDYQMSALLMAIWFSGMDDEEISNLTLSMVRSGKVIDLSGIPGVKVDKHSSGGVADTVTLPLVAIVAANGIPVPKMSGRGLGHTGGTIDKLESIPGFRVEMSIKDFIDTVNRVGGAIISQSEEVAVADKKMYALRDVTGSVDSIPLIASSIMSKKIASGSDAIVLDVKVGNGAFMQTIEDAVKLAVTMVNIGTSLGKETVAYVTDMDEPLGDCIGNSIEVEEAVEVLKGRASSKLLRVIKVLGAEILRIGGRAKNLEEGQEIIEQTIQNGSGLAKFAEIVRAQGGNPEVIENFNLLPQASVRLGITLEGSGYVKSIKAKQVGMLASFLGAGRLKKEDKIELSVGIKLWKRVGDYIDKGELVGEILANSQQKAEEALKVIRQLIELSEAKTERRRVIYYRISKEGTEEVLQ